MAEPRWMVVARIAAAEGDPAVEAEAVKVAVDG